MYFKLLLFLLNPRKATKANTVFAPLKRLLALSYKQVPHKRHTAKAPAYNSK
jgi:hypothetical protein